MTPKMRARPIETSAVAALAIAAFTRVSMNICIPGSWLPCCALAASTALVGHQLFLAKTLDDLVAMFFIPGRLIAHLDNVDIAVLDHDDRPAADKRVVRSEQVFTPPC